MPAQPTSRNQHTQKKYTKSSRYFYRTRKKSSPKYINVYKRKVFRLQNCLAISHIYTYSVMQQSRMTHRQTQPGIVGWVHLISHTPSGRSATTDQAEQTLRVSCIYSKGDIYTEKMGPVAFFLLAYGRITLFFSWHWHPMNRHSKDSSYTLHSCMRC